MMVRLFDSGCCYERDRKGERERGQRKGAKEGQKKKEENQHDCEAFPLSRSLSKES
jgi:hypothetical protein